MSSLKDINLQQFHSMVDDIIVEAEKNSMKSAEAKPKKVQEEPATAKEVVAAVKKVIKSNKVLVTDTVTAEKFSFDNAVLAAKHFGIHQTTARTRCSAKMVINNQEWKYVE